jgi:hypothetical protein
VLYTIRPIDQVMGTDAVPEPKRIRHGSLEMEVLPVYPGWGVISRVFSTDPEDFARQPVGEMVRL